MSNEVTKSVWLGTPRSSTSVESEKFWTADGFNGVIAPSGAFGIGVTVGVGLGVEVDVAVAVGGS
jgi:hypothetical protein